MKGRSVRHAAGSLLAAIGLALVTVPAVAGNDEWFGDEAPVYVPRDRVVLFEIETPGLEYTEQLTVNYIVKRELAALAYYNILAGEELARILDVHRVPTCSDEDCRRKVALATGAVEYIYGDASGSPKDAEIRLKRIRTSDGSVVSSKEMDWSGEAISIPWLSAYLAIQLYLPRESMVDGQLQLDVQPKYAEIRADGSEVKIPSDLTIRLEAGIHQMEISQPGYEPQMLPVVIIPRRVNFQRVTLNPK